MLSKRERASLRLMFGGKCAYCGVDLPEKGWHADHIEPLQRKYRWNPQDGYVPTGEFYAPENNRKDNLFPTCQACNIDKGSSNLETFRRTIADKVGVCRRNYSAFRHAERFGRVHAASGPVIFWFEKYSAERSS